MENRIVFHVGMTFPEPSCSRLIFLRYRSLLQHWKTVHTDNMEMQGLKQFFQATAGYQSTPEELPLGQRPDLPLSESAVYCTRRGYGDSPVTYPLSAKWTRFPSLLRTRTLHVTRPVRLPGWSAFAPGKGHWEALLWLCWTRN